MLEERFATLLNALGPFSSLPHLAVALSGGADSLALTLLAAQWAHQHGGQITALTVDHRLRAESTAEAAQVAALMRARGIAHHILTPEHTHDSNNLQETAREWRYRALAEHCRAQGILHCLVGHTAGDNRETALHHLSRGDTADGPAGMARIRNFSGIRFLRPLLTIERADLEAYLHTQGVVWIDDPSNNNTRFARVRNRSALQQNTQRVSELNAILVEHAAARSARDDALAEAAMRIAIIHPSGFVLLDHAGWRALAPRLASQLLADCITTISGAIHRPRAADTERLVSALQHTDFRKRTLQHCEITLRGGSIRIAREASRVDAPVTLTGKRECRWDKRFQVRYDLVEGTQYQLAALGTQGRKYMRVLGHDLPAATPALWHLDELVFVPHITLPYAVAGRVSIGFTPAKPLAAAPFW